MSCFVEEARDVGSRARVGRLSTLHGEVETPAYVVVGTHAEVRCLRPEDLPRAGVQMIIANTYHLWRQLGNDLETFEGLHKRMQWPGPIMTDSGGFQVFSLGFAREHKVGKHKDKPSRHSARADNENLVRITDDGVFFLDNGEELFLNPELSITIQEQLGADIAVAFDECTSPEHDYNYTRESLERTHRWADRSLRAHTRDGQLLYGVVQGGAFQDLRERSARFIATRPFDGVAIGGAFGGSFGSTREETLRELDWVIPYLPTDRPRHLLGIGRIEDVFEGVERGVDTFDCVIPTREARHGGIWTRRGRFDVKRGVFRNSTSVLEEGCECPVCSYGGDYYTDRGGLHLLFKERDPRATHLATLHNVFFFNYLMGEIRRAIREGMFSSLKREALSTLKGLPPVSGTMEAT